MFTHVFYIDIYFLFLSKVRRMNKNIIEHQFTGASYNTCLFVILRPTRELFTNMKTYVLKGLAVRVKVKVRMRAIA